MIYGTVFASCRLFQRKLSVIDLAAVAALFTADEVKKYADE